MIDMAKPAERFTIEQNVNGNWYVRDNAAETNLVNGPYFEQSAAQKWADYFNENGV